MQKHFTLAITGDSIINRRISTCTEERFLSLIRILQDADVAYTHFETIIHDYEGPELYPAAEPGRTPLRSPAYVADELKWAGFDIVSLAHNHCLDYSYGGLFSTWKALNEAKLPHAGTGMNLAEAREPAYLDTRLGRMALISMTSSFSRWGRAGEARRDMKGRPGVNPLRFYHVVNATTLEMLKQLAPKMGLKTQQVGNTVYFNVPGAENTVIKFMQSTEPGVSTVAEEEDAEGNLLAIRDARRQADFVLVHLHSHEWDPDKGVYAPPKFIPPFVHACIDTGADMVVSEGCHHPMRGIEIYKGKPIFYDPGDLMKMNNTITRLPADLYTAPLDFGKSAAEATPADLYDARDKLPKLAAHRDGLVPPPIPNAAVVAVCSFNEGWKPLELVLHPVTLRLKPRSASGFPMLASEDDASRIIAYMKDLSAPFGTQIEYRDGRGFVKL